MDKRQPPLPTRKVGDKLYVVDRAKPAWYCQWCHRYLLKEEAVPQRMPMRNHLEGCYTRWHMDVAYPNLRPALRRLYLDLTTLPSAEDAQEWHRRYEEYVALLRAPEDQRTAAQCAQAETHHAWLEEMNLAWDPPPSLS